MKLAAILVGTIISIFPMSELTAKAEILGYPQGAPLQVNLCRGAPCGYPGSMPIDSIFALVQDVSSAEMQHSSTNRSFQPIEQPLPIKVGVVLGGLTLVGAELWWFLGRKQQKQQATQSNGVQEVLVTVDGGYRPERVVVVVNEPVRLLFHRLDRNSCLDEVLIPDFGISTRLPVGQTTTVEFTPTKVGEYAFTCGMRMFRGVIEVKATQSLGQNLLAKPDIS